jgi:hypothetical protein
MAATVAIIAVVACCTACGYAISQAIRRSRERRTHKHAVQIR